MQTYIPPPDQEHHQKELKDVLPLPTLIMCLIAKTKSKIPSNLTVVQRDYSIGANTMT